MQIHKEKDILEQKYISENPINEIKMVTGNPKVYLYLIIQYDLLNL